MTIFRYTLSNYSFLGDKLDCPLDRLDEVCVNSLRDGEYDDLLLFRLGLFEDMDLELFCCFSLY